MGGRTIGYNRRFAPHNYREQRGSNIFKSLMPHIKSFGKSLGKKALEGSMDFIKGVAIDKKPAKQVLKEVAAKKFNEFLTRKSADNTSQLSLQKKKKKKKETSSATKSGYKRKSDQPGFSSQRGKGLYTASHSQKKGKRSRKVLMKRVAL